MNEKAPKRDARNPRYRWAYWGHRAQGFALGCILGWGMAPLLVRLYARYQSVEYERFRDRRDTLDANNLRRADPSKKRSVRAVERLVVDDGPSRDLMDFMAGAWAGMATGLAWQAVALMKLGG